MMIELEIGTDDKFLRAYRKLDEWNQERFFALNKYMGMVSNNLDIVKSIHVDISEFRMILEAFALAEKKS